MRIAMFSGPRNLSTALMRSFGARADTKVVDEPFYAAYLAATGLDHPMRAEILAAGETDPVRVAAACAQEPDPTRGPPVRYEKHMTHHMLPGTPTDWLDGARIAFLIREPARVVASYAAKRENPTLADLGVEAQSRLFHQAWAALGAPPPVVEASEIRRTPEPALRKLCSALDLPFDPAMLKWPPGARPTDGVWGAHWYGSVNASTDFTPPDAGATPSLPAALQRLVDAAQPFHDQLAAHALRA